MEENKALTLARKYAGTAETCLRKADREYAYYKNGAFGDPQSHYLTSQQSYGKARDIAQKGLDTMWPNGLNDAELESRLRDVLSKCGNK